MPANGLGQYVRERRQDLGLTQEQLAERIGGNASQAEVSRIERGAIAFPRRSRLEALAGALEVTLGTLLVHAGWMASHEADQVEGLPSPPGLDPRTTAAMLAEMAHFRETLLTAIDRIGQLEETLKASMKPAPRSNVNPPAGAFDDWEASQVFIT